MLRIIKNGQTSVVLRAKLLDSSSTTGAGLTGLTSASTGLIIGTIANNEATATTYTVAGSTVESITTLGTFAAPTATKCRFKEVDSTNHKGLYEFQFADARFAVSNAQTLVVSVSGATNLQQADFLIQLQSDDPYVAKPANFASLFIDSNGRLDVIKIAGTTQTARDLGLSVLLSSGTGTGQLDVTSGMIKSNLTQILGTTLTETAGQIAGGFKKLFNVASPVFTAQSVNQTGDNYARIGAPAGPSVSADIAAAKSDTAAIKANTDQMQFTPNGSIYSNIEEINEDLAAADRLQRFVNTMVLGVVGIGSTTTDFAIASLSPFADINDQWAGRILIFNIDTLTPELRGQATVIVSHGASGPFTVQELTAAPQSGDTFIILDLSASASSGPTSTEIANEVLKLDWTTITGEADRSLLNAARFLRNKFSLEANPGFVTVYKEDDTTEAYQKPVTTDPAALPITEG